MQSPELLLKDLNRALLELNAASVVLNDEELSAKLKDVTRRLVLAEVLTNTWILAIGGSQGAGKTTLLMSMYGLTGGSDDWLKPNEGRGERLPVLVLEEDSCQVPHGALRKLGPLHGMNHRFGVVEQSVDMAEFQAAICGADPAVVLPVLYVPRTYFHRPGQGFLLLPGYEPVDQGNNGWQQLMRQALVGAAGCIVVTDETRLASQQQAKILRDMLDSDLRDTAPLIVLSKTEGLASQPQRMGELCARAAAVFQVPDCDVARRVHCVGSSDPNYRTQWLPRLAEALNDMAMGSLGSRQAQLTRLEEVLAKDLGQVIKLCQVRARLHFGRGAGEDGSSNEVVNRCLEAFDEARDDLQVRFKGAVIGLVKARSNAAWSTLESTLIEEHEGFGNKLGSLLDTVSETQRSLSNDTEAAWQQQGDLLEAFAAVTGALTHRQLAGPSQSMGEKSAITPVPGASDVLQRLEYVGKDHKAVSWGRPTEADLQNLQVILGVDNAARDAQGHAALPVLATKELEATVRLLPAMALEYARLASLMPALVGVDPKALTALPSGDVAGALQSVRQQFEQVTDISKTILRGIAMVMALDIGMDGHIDTLPALLNVLTGRADISVEGGAAGTGAAVGGVSVAGAVVGVIAVGYLAHAALQEVRRYDGQVRSVAHQMLMSIADHHQVHFMAHFNQLMDQLRIHLRQRLRHRYRLGEQLMTQDRLAKALADVAGGQRDLLEQLALSGHTLSILAVTRR